ncbi:unnamed protein product [Oppiella nova]|uniref:Uncharacterized protein n=1 Tax=Oppiella nova TaxID=334625 RepID=A0A7R9MB73_9ACAR|nr:unnamed protein product [Oppiella nova]CAG2174179.1 unnamed protein product [Oppiella nova]
MLPDRWRAITLSRGNAQIKFQSSTLIIVIALSAVISVAQNNDKKISDQDFKNAKKVTIAIIATIGSICILFELLGLLGAYKEHYCLTMTYAILMFMMTWGSIGGAVRVGTFWVTFGVNVMITTLAFLYARDLHRRRHQSTAMYVTGRPAYSSLTEPVNTYPAPSYGATPAYI